MTDGLYGHPAALDATRDAQRAKGTPALACDAQHPRRGVAAAAAAVTLAAEHATREAMA